MALARWEQAGLKFVVEEGPGEHFTDPTGWAPAIPKAIRLIRDATDRTDFAIYNAQIDGSLAAFTLDRFFFDKVNGPWAAGAITHELGHCLGLDHGGGGVMEGNFKPDVHDIESVRDYYHGV